MDYKKDRDNTVKLDINSEGCKDIWMVTEQENAYDKAVAVGRKKSKYSRFQPPWKLENYNFHEGINRDRKMRQFRRKIKKQTKEENEGYDD